MTDVPGERSCLAQFIWAGLASSPGVPRKITEVRRKITEGEYQNLRKILSFWSWASLKTSLQTISAIG